MAKKFTPKVVTANHLLDGDAIYLDPQGAWVRNHSEAKCFTQAREAEAALVRALAEPAVVVGPYLAEASAGPHGPLPVHFREAFRTRGPSNYFHGKQAENFHV